MTLRVAVLASGRGSNMDSILEKSSSGLLDAKVTLVLTDRVGVACAQKAKDAGVPAVVELPAEDGEGRDDYDARLIEALQAEDPDLIVLAGFMRILTPAFCGAFAGKVINIHPALLPAFKGRHGIRDTLDGGARLAGCSTHFVTADLDGGPIILQAALAIHPDDHEERLAGRVLVLEHQILPRTIQLIADGRVSVEDGIVRIADGPSWKDRVEAVEGALYPYRF